MLLKEDLRDVGYIAHALLLITIFFLFFRDYEKILALVGAQAFFFSMITIQAFLFFQLIVDVKFLIPNNLAKIIYDQYDQEVVKLLLFLVLYLVGSNLYKSYLANNLEKIN